jgi:hypothetical protein
MEPRLLSFFAAAEPNPGPEGGRPRRRLRRYGSQLCILCVFAAVAEGCYPHYDAYVKLERSYGGYTILGDPPNVAFASYVTDEKLAQALPLLKKVQVQDLSLNSTDISDASVPRIAELKTVTTLDVIGTRVTADALPRLRELPRLKYLSVWSETFDDAAIARLEQSLPGVKIRRDNILSNNDRARANLEKLKATPELKAALGN